MSKAIDYLISQGRDPLEVILIPPAPDIVEYLEADRLDVLDQKLVARLDKYFSPEELERLRVLFARHEQALKDKARPASAPAPDSE